MHLVLSRVSLQGMRDKHQLRFCDEMTSIITKSPVLLMQPLHNSMAHKRALNQHNFLLLYTAFGFVFL